MKFWQKLTLFSVFLLSSCGAPHGCSPKFSDLKTLYPHVLYHGPKVPSEVVLKRFPPALWVNLSQVSKKAQGAILVSEDWAFYQHHGYDEKQIREVIEEGIEKGKLKRGASTITQQVVKNIYLSKEKSIIRKVRELWMATKIEKVVGKRRIFELYLNIAEFGEGIFGIGNASSHYFHKNASDLNAKEGAFLAMLLPSPKKYAISYRQKNLTRYARRTMRSVMNKMVQANYIDTEARDREWGAPLSFEARVDLSVPSDESLNSDEDELNDETD